MKNVYNARRLSLFRCVLVLIRDGGGSRGGNQVSSVLRFGAWEAAEQ